MTKLKRFQQLLKRVVVVAMLVYPGVHFAFHHYAMTDPWTLAGWAMYTAPRAQVAVHVVRPQGSRAASAICPLETTRYVKRRVAFGRLADGGELLSCLNAVLEPGYRVQVVHRMFDGASGMFQLLEQRLL